MNRSIICAFWPVFSIISEFKERETVYKTEKHEVVDSAEEMVGSVPGLGFAIN